MKKIFTLILSLVMMIIFSQQLHAQISFQDYADINNVKALVHADGSLFWNIYGNRNASFEIPKGEGKHTVFASQLWLGGLDPGGQLYTAAQTYRQNQGSTNAADFWPGPLNGDGSTNDPESWSQLWKVHKTSIDEHKQNYHKPGYVVPPEILYWPGHRPDGSGYILAPFIDINANGIYEPLTGDYPHIRGDQALFFILNDAYGTHQHFTGAGPLHVEVQGMVYAFNSSDLVLNNTLFINYKIINFSSIPYHDFYAGVWADFDIGNYADDYIGTDVARNMIYAYNADSIDEGNPGHGAELGYGLHPPAQGIILLNQTLSKSIYHSNQSIPNINGDPTNATELYFALMGFWSDSTPVTKGGTGKDGAESGNYVFDGDVCAMNGWTESSASMTSGDRRMMGSTGPYTLALGDVFELDLAYVYARDMNSDNSVCALQSAADHIIELYNTGQVTSVHRGKAKELSISPNPFSDLSILKFNNPNKEKFIMNIYDARGVLMRRSDAGTSDEVIIKKEGLSAGVYLVSLTSEKNNFYSKLIVE